MTNTRWNDQIEFYASKRFAVTPAVKRLKREGSTNIEEFITRMIIFSETIEDIGGRYTRLLLAPMQPAIELILPSAARLGIRGAAFYLVQRPHLPLLSLSFRSHVPSPSTGDSPPTRIPRRIRAYIPFCFHFPCIFLYFVYLYIYVKQLFEIGKKDNELLFRYLESKVNLKLTFSPLEHSTQKTFPPKRSVAIKYRVNNPPRTKRLDR